MNWSGFVALGTISGGVFTELTEPAYARRPFAFGSLADGRAYGTSPGVEFDRVPGPQPMQYDAYGFFTAADGGTAVTAYPLGWTAEEMVGVAHHVQPCRIVLSPSQAQALS
jgi:hypothetical protein